MGAKTIDNILEYNISEEEQEALLSCGIINGCGGEGAFSFDIFIEDNLEYLSYFDIEKKQELICDLKRICYEHDIGFRFHIGFTRANFKMCNKVRKLLYWVTPFKRLAIVSILFILLQKKGGIFYKK